METVNTFKLTQTKSSLAIHHIAYVMWGVLLLFVTSQLSIPLEPVPITLQTVGVMLIGLTFERSHAIKAVLVYLGLGAVGIPVFANYHGGGHWLFGMSGGYLWGFLAAVALMTSLRQRYLQNHSVLHIGLNCFFGTTVIFLFGITWLAYSIGLKAAIYSGFYPFIIPGAVKIVLLTTAVRYLKLGRR